jgi:hypothetical protein
MNRTRTLGEKHFINPQLKLPTNSEIDAINRSEWRL